MKWDVLTTASDIVSALSDSHGVISIDTETTGLDPFTDKILSIQVCTRTDYAIYFGAEHASILQTLKNKRIVFHNFKFDLHFLSRLGVDLMHGNDIVDTMLIHHLVDENLSHKLDDLIQEHFKDTYKSDFWGKYASMQEAPEDDKVSYACKDAIYTRELYIELCLKAREIGIPDALVSHVHKLAHALFDMESRGILIDMAYLLDLRIKYQDMIHGMRQNLPQGCDQHIRAIEFDMYEKEQGKRKTERGKMGVKIPQFNWDSPAQVAELLYGQLGLPPILNKAKNRTVDDAALEKLSTKSPVAEKLRKYREVQKVYTAFLQGTTEKMKNDRIYPSFNVNGTVTGRISSSNPNLQQLPTEGGIRGIYIPDPGYSFVSADYQQLEVVIAAHFSQDKNLLKIVRDGVSKHDITASELKLPRSQAKTLNFAMQYQCTAYKISSMLGCSIKEAEYIWNRYWETYAGERKVIDECEDKLMRGEPIVNPFGRQRHFPAPDEIKELNEFKRASLFRQAYSSLIQGTGADLTSRAFYLVKEAFVGLIIGKALFTVHDEILTMPLKGLEEAAGVELEMKMIGVGEEVNLTLPLSVAVSKPMTRWEKS